MREENPAGEERKAAVSSPVRQGVVAALILFVIAALADVATMVAVRRYPNPGDHVNAFLGLGMTTALLGLLAASIISSYLPKEARRPFWLAGVGCISMAAIVWGVTCGVALT